MDKAEELAKILWEPWESEKNDLSSPFYNFKLTWEELEPASKKYYLKLANKIIDKVNCA